MAACSEEKQPSQEKRLLASKSFDSSTNKEDALQARNSVNSEMSKTVEANEGNKKNSIDICSLTEEQLHLLLEEATTFNRPKDEDSSILRALRKEIVESDPCGDVNSNESTFSTASASHGKKKSKSSVNCGAGKNKVNATGDDKSLNLDYNTFLGWHKPCGDSSSSRKTYRGKNRDDIACPGGKKEVQFQSLQDLHSARFCETFDSMRAAGIGRGARKLHKASRANSFTLASCERSSEWPSLPAQDGRTFAGKSKSKAWSTSDETEKTAIDTGVCHGDTSSSRSLSESEGTVSESVALNNWSTCSSDSSSSPEKDDCQMETIPTLICDRAKDDSDISLLSCRPLADDGDVFYSGVKCVRHPVEIEMVEFTKEEATSVDMCCRSFVCNFEGNAQMDVDAPVNFPLKSVCPTRSRSEVNYLSRNNPHLNGMLDEFNHCGISTLSFPYRSKSVAGTLVDDSKHDDKDDRALRKKKKSPRQEFGDEQKILQHFDHNGNPVRGIPYSAGSYSLDGHTSKQEGIFLRKGKRTKLNTDIRNIFKSEDVDGYRGKEDIDSLVEFINSSGGTVKNKGSHKSTNGSAIYMHFGDGSKNGMELDKKRDKSFSKDNKTVFKMTVKKSGCGAPEDGENTNNEEEQLVRENDVCEYHNTLAANESDGEDPPIVAEQEHETSGSPTDDNTPINDNESDVNNVNVPSPNSSVPTGDGLAAGFVEDFYAVTEVPPVLEESEFRVVVNKQKKRRQAKKPDSYRRHSSVAGSSSKYGERDYYLSDQSYQSSMLLSGLRGMPDTIRRKSTSSVPPSEHSSADNSDLDSVHSLPVGGSVPPATRVHPHTTPSSMSSTPQASYADIARISTKENRTESLSDCLHKGSSNTLDRTSAISDAGEEESGSKFIAIDSMQDFPENAVVLECSVLEGREKCTDVQSLTFHGTTLGDKFVPEEASIIESKNSELIKTENVGNGDSPKSQKSDVVPKAAENIGGRGDSMELCEADAQPVRILGDDSASSSPPCAGKKVSGVRDKPSSKKNQPKDTVQSAPSRPSAKSHGRPPVIIFDNCQPSVNVCDVSFGFDLNEILRLSAHEHQSGESSKKASGGSRGSAIETGGASANISNSNRQSDGKSSQSESVVVISGQRYQWKEAKADTRNFNHAQVVDFFGMAWDNVVRDYQNNPNDEDGRKCNKIKYYTNQC